jgi:transcriptional regulator with XRE-family HTH domain
MRTRLQVVADRAAAESLHAVGDQLRNLREDAGISQAAVARVVGIHPSYVRLVENGRREASLVVLHRVSAAGIKLKKQTPSFPFWKRIGPSRHRLWHP